MKFIDLVKFLRMYGIYQKILLRALQGYHHTSISLTEEEKNNLLYKGFEARSYVIDDTSCTNTYDIYWK